MSETEKPTEPVTIEETAPPNVEEFVEDGKNKYLILCTHCPSKILPPSTGVYVKQERKLPKMTQKKDAPEVETDTIQDWLFVDCMFTFENVGVSNMVDNIKYLTCADCEYGPIGVLEIANQNSYVAISRVRHDKPT